MEFVVAIVFILLIVFLILAFVVTNLLVKPPWYTHNEFGHYNRCPAKGLTKNVVGAAKTLWRISETVDGLGNPKETFGFNYEEVEIPNLHVRQKNRVLRGWLIPHLSTEPENEICIVAVHGGGRDRRAWLRHTPIFVHNGCSVLMFDFEEHGISDGAQRGIGWCTYEPDNVLAAVEYTKHTLQFKHIIVVGTSMGGAASIVAAGLGFKHHITKCLEYRDPREHIDAVIAENPFTTRKALMKFILDNTSGDILGRMKGILRPFTGALIATGLWRIGDAKHATPLDAVRRVKCPLLIMHGTADAIIPHTHSEILYREATQTAWKKLWIVDGAQHTALHNAAPEEWESRVLSIVNKIRG